MTDDYIKIISPIVGMIGLGLTLYLAIVKKSHKKPKIEVTIGIEKMYCRERRWVGRKIPKENILFGFDKSKVSNPIIFVPISIRNKSTLPTTDIKIRVTFPSTFRIEGSFFPEKGREDLFLYVEKDDSRVKALDLIEYSDHTQYTYTVEKIRIGEEIAIPLFVRAEPSPEEETFSNQFHSERYKAASNYISSMTIHVGVYSPDVKSFEKSINLIRLNCKNHKEISDSLNQIIEISWDNQKPSAGLYIINPIRNIFRPNPYKAKKPLKEEYTEVFFSDLQISDLSTKGAKVPIDKLKHIPDIFTIISVPPWGLFGESFDLSGMGLKKLKAFK